MDKEFIIPITRLLDDVQKEVKNEAVSQLREIMQNTFKKSFESDSEIIEFMDAENIEVSIDGGEVSSIKKVDGEYNAFLTPIKINIKNKKGD